jgi:ribA/ribD-fused uncharacterized protein
MIEQFKDEYRWLSNFWFYDTPMLVLNGMAPIHLGTNEHFYVAMKTTDNVVRKAVAEHNLKGLKKFGATIELRSDWEDIKLEVMEYGLRYKFSQENPNLRAKLIATGDEHIQEGNNWNDTFWGVDLATGKGENHLGKLLMKIRSEIIEEDK